MAASRSANFCAIGAAAEAEAATAVAIWIELGHFIRNFGDAAIEFQSVRRINLFGEQTEDGVARAVPGRIAGAATGKAMRLAPTVFCRAERVVTRKAGKLGIFGPDIIFIEAFAFRAPHEAIHFGAKLDGLAGAPIADASPSRVFDGFSGARIRAEISNGAA